MGFFAGVFVIQFTVQKLCIQTKRSMSAIGTSLRSLRRKI
jgi:hypothetical protein